VRFEPMKPAPPVTMKLKLDSVDDIRNDCY
jgi:hypothetical protein